MKRAQLIADELVQTERNYVKHLYTLSVVFLAPMRAHRVLSELPEIQAFLSNVEQVQLVNSKFVLELEDAVRSKELNIGSVFVNFAPFFKMYGQYASNHDIAMAKLAALRTSSSSVEKLFVDLESNPLCGGQTAASLFIMPIQRVPRYLLLLKELLKNLSESDSDYACLKQAIIEVSKAADFINESIKRRQNRDKILEIERRLGGQVELFEPGRILLLEATLQQLSHRGSLVDAVFILFSDLLLLCSSNILGGPIVSRKIPLVSASVQRTVSKGLGVDPDLSFEFLSPSVSFVASAKTKTEKNDWVEKLESAISATKKIVDAQVLITAMPRSLKDVHKSRVSCAFSSLTSQEVQTAPIWEMDTLVHSCSICNSQFTLFNRRHHCRNW